MTNRNPENLLLDIFWPRHQGNVYTYFLFPKNSLIASYSIV